MNLKEAVRQHISPCIDFLAAAYRQNDERSIKEHGRRPAYTHACLEQTTIASIAAGPRVYKVSVPCGLYEHSGPQTLDNPAILLTLWGMAGDGKPVEPKTVDGMTVVGVADDGHCLFAGIGLKTGDSVRKLRQMASTYIEQHPELIPDVANPRQYAMDLNNMDRAILWGGDPELMALAEVLGRVIVVHRDGQPPEIFQGDMFAHADMPAYAASANDIHIYHCSTQGEAGPLNHFDGLV
jgi:hypothetical protein